MAITKSQVSRTAVDWSRYAQENVSVEVSGDTLYGFCPSELGALRLYHQYRGAKNVRAFLSAAHGWVFALVVNFSAEAR
jgi:hypothetical protein